MAEKDFKVCYYGLCKLCLSLLIIAGAFYGLYAFFIRVYKDVDFGGGLGVGLLCAGVFLVLAAAAVFTVFSAMFYVKVSGCEISVRTKSLRRYKFHISEVKKVVCSKYHVYHGDQYNIAITTETEELALNMEMNNLDKMARYITQKLESGEMSKTLELSEKSKKTLLEFGKYRKTIFGYVLTNENQKKRRRFR